MGKKITNSKEETQKFAGDFAEEILKKAGKNKPLTFQFNEKVMGKNQATIVGLYGDLGAGKTTFTQGFAKGLGIKQKIISPTFIILKKFKIIKKSSSFAKATEDKQDSKNLPSATRNSQLNLIHIDAYRLESPEEILSLNWKELISNPQNIILIEWADKIKKFLPKNYIKINFKFINENKREIIIKNSNSQTRMMKKNQ